MFIMPALCSMLRLYYSAPNYAGIVYLTQETALLIASFLLDAILKAITWSPYVPRERDQMHFCHVEPTQYFSSRFSLALAQQCF